MVSRRLRLPSACVLLVAIGIAGWRHDFGAQPTTLNLSQDLVALGIAGSNMVPNQPALDAGPLLYQGVEYAKQHAIPRVIADPGSYFFLGLQTSNAHVQLAQVSNLTIDFQGSDLVFTHTLQYGIVLFFGTNVVLQNFTADYQPLPFTQLRVTAVDAAHARLQYSVEPGWQAPSAFNSAQPSPGTGGIVPEVHVFRNGRFAAGTRRMAAQFPFSGSQVTIVPNYGFDPTPGNMAAIRPGDIAVVAMRQFGEPLVTNRCRGCTLRNITVYAAASAAIESMHSESTTWERVYSIPKPGTDRLISSFGFGFQAMGPGNQVRLSRAIRTLDGGLAFFVWCTGQVESQSSPRTLVIAGAGASLGQGVTISNGSPVVFQRRSDGAILASAVLVSQSGSVEVYNPDHLTYTFDRDLPVNLVGAVMYTTDVNQRGGNSVIERNNVQDKSCCYGMDIWGWAGSIVRGNYIRRIGFAGIGGIQSLMADSWTTPPLVDMTFRNNVIDGTKMMSAWWLHGLGGLQTAAIGPDVNGHPDQMRIGAHQNIAILDNFIADPGRAAIWLGNTTGGSISGNLLLHANQRLDLAAPHPPQTDVIAPLILDTTTNGVTTARNIVDQVSGRVFVTDTQHRELAAYAPGGTLRLSAYDIGTLASPTVTLTDADGVTSPMIVQSSAAHALDVQVPATAALGGAFVTLTSGGAKYFGTLFLDSQDHIPAVNGCTFQPSLSSMPVSSLASAVPILVVTQAGCSYQVVSMSSFVTAAGGGSGTGVVAVEVAANRGAARTATIEIAGQPVAIPQSATTAPVSVDDAYSTTRATPLVIAGPGVLGNDNASGATALSASLVAGAAHGSVTLDAAGGFTYTPDLSFIGADAFTYRAVSDAGPGNVATVRLTVNETTVPQPPTGLYVSAQVGNQLTFRFTPPAFGPPPTGYVLEGGLAPGQVMASLPLDTVPILNLAIPSGSFYVRVHTLAGAARSGPSTEIRIFVNVPAPPSPPASLTGLVNGSALGLSWRNTFGGGAPASLLLDVSGAISASIPLGLSEAFAFSGVPGGTYTLSLRAVNSSGTSTASNAVTVLFPGACFGPPQPPAALLAYRLGRTVYVTWEPPPAGPAASGYVLTVTGSLVVSIPTAVRSLSGTVGPGTYNLSVAATNACGSSAATAVQTVMVP